MAMLVGHQKDLLLKTVIASWVKVIVDRRQEATRQTAAHASQQRQEESRRKAIAAMLGNDALAARVAAQNAFVVWRRHLSDLRKERESERRMATIFAGNQVKVILGTAFAGWSRLSTDQRRKMKRGQEIMAMLVGHQKDLLLKTVIASWVKVIVDRRQEATRQTVAHASQQRQEESRRKAIAAMLGNDALAARVAAQNAFVVWRRHLSDLRKERVSERRMATIFAGNQVKVVLGTAFAGWGQLSADAR